MCRKNGYRAYTNNIFKRLEVGCPFLSITSVILIAIFDFTYIVMVDFFQDENIGLGIFLLLLQYTLISLAYWAFLVVVFTDAGSTPSDYVHPLSNIDNSRVGQTENNSEHEGLAQADIYKLILQNFTNNSKNSDPRRAYDGRIMSHSNSVNEGDQGQDIDIEDQNIETNRQRIKDRQTGIDIVVSTFRYRY